MNDQLSNNGQEGQDISKPRGNVYIVGGVVLGLLWWPLLFRFWPYMIRLSHAVPYWVDDLWLLLQVAVPWCVALGLIERGLAIRTLRRTGVIRSRLRIWRSVLLVSLGIILVPAIVLSNGAGLLLIVSFWALILWLWSLGLVVRTRVFGEWLFAWISFLLITACSSFALIRFIGGRYAWCPPLAEVIRYWDENGLPEERLKLVLIVTALASMGILARAAIKCWRTEVVIESN